MGGCSNKNTEGDKNELGNYITFEKVSTAKNIEIMKDVTMNISAFEHGGHLRIEDGKNLFPKKDGELLGIIAKVNNQSASSIHIENFLNCKEGSVFMIDESYYPVSNYHVEGKGEDGIVQPNEEKTVYLYTNANKLRVLTKTKIRNIAIEWKSKANSSFFAIFLIYR